MPNRVKQALGFSLVELAIVLGIIGLLLFLFIPTNTTMLVNQRRANTVQKLANIESALLNFVIVNKRLPCPADGSIDLTIAPLNALAGKEGGHPGLGDCTASPVNQASGVVPWVDLGLGFNDVLDAWDNQITYRVAYGLTRPNALDMSACDPAGGKAAFGATAPVNTGSCDTSCSGIFDATKCTSPQNFLQGKGLDVKSSTATIAMNYAQIPSSTGAAYVLISHGENGYGAINAAGQYQGTATRGVAGTTLENPNRNLPALIVPVAPTAPPQFMSAPYSNAEDAAIYFDDIVVRPLVFSVINKANLGPRSH